VKSLEAHKQTSKRKAGIPMATYRVTLRIDVNADDIVRSRGKETLKELQRDGGDYLREHVENEMGWLEESFSHVEIESITRLQESKSASKSKAARKSKR
jgi:hypothetical protein